MVQAITRTREQQLRLAADAGAVFVRGAELERSLVNQHLVLTGAAEQIDQAKQVAQRAAADARAAGGVDSAPYERTADGLQSQLELVLASIDQLAALRAGARANLTDAHRLLQDNAATLDQALRVEIRLLGQLERLERQRIITQARARANPPESAGS